MARMGAICLFGFRRLIFFASRAPGATVSGNTWRFSFVKSRGTSKVGQLIYIYIYVRACMYVNIIRLYVSTYMCYYDISERL